MTGSGRRVAWALFGAVVLLAGSAVVAPSLEASPTGGTCPVAYDQKVYVPVPLPAGAHVQGTIGIDCTGAGYTQMPVPAGGPSPGSIGWAGANNESYTYTPAGGYRGADTVSYCQVPTANPQQGCTGGNATGFLTFYMYRARPDRYVTPVNTVLNVGCDAVCAQDPLANDEPAAPISPLVRLDVGPSHGDLGPDGLGCKSWSEAAFCYTPNTGYKGLDSFTYCLVISQTGNSTGCPATVLATEYGISGIVDAASSNVVTVTIDVGGAPLRPTVTLTSPTAPFTLHSPTGLSWTNADYSGGPGLAFDQLLTQRARWNAAFGASSTGPLMSPTTTGAHPGLAVGYDSCFQIRVTDANRYHADSVRRCTAMPVDDATLTASRGWARRTSSLDYRGTYSVTSTRGATLTAASAQVDRVALVATRCPGCGKVGIYAGTTLLATIDLAHASTVHQALFTLTAFRLRTATLKIKVLSSGKPVRIDGLGISRT